MSAPQRGEEPEFDEMADRVWAVLQRAGNPESITEEVMRDVLHHRLAQFSININEEEGASR